MKQVGLWSGSQKARDFGKMRCYATHYLAWSVMTSWHACSCNFERDVARQHYVSSSWQADVSTRVMLIGQTESETTRVILLDVTVQRRLESDAFGCVIGKKLDGSPFSYHFHKKTTHFGFAPRRVVRIFFLLLNNVQKQIPFFGFISWGHYVTWVKHNSFCRLDDREVEFVRQTTCNYAWYVRKRDPCSSLSFLYSAGEIKGMY